MTHHDVDITGGRMRLGESQSARTKQAIRRALFAGAATTAALTVILLPDFFGRYMERDPTGGWISLASIAALGALIGMALGTSRAIRQEAWEVDARTRELAFERKLPGRPPIKEVMGFEEISCFELSEDALSLVMKEGLKIPMLRGGGGAKAEREAVAAKLSAYLKTHGSSLAIKRA